VSRRVYLVAALALVVIAAAAVLVAARTDPRAIAGATDPTDLPVLAPSVPDLDAAKGWLNSKPLRAADLKGKVVVYDFWTYSCVNCVRTLPHIRAWYDRYRADGLVVVGVHSPEFEFEKDHDNVARAVNDLGVDWPVAFDDDKDIWTSFRNQYWPAKYVTDRQGRLRFVHYGEGAYDDTEDVLRSLLGVAASAPRADDGTVGDPIASPLHLTPETYLGAARGTTASPEGLVPGEQELTVPDPLPDDSFALSGTWRIGQDLVESAGGTGDDTIVLSYQATEVNLVMSVAGDEPIDVVVELDGAPVPDDARPKGMTMDDEGRTVVRVQAADLYRLVLGGPTGPHTLRLTPQADGLQAFAFTFGNE
jgi:thiol-disulfide isomerase/thioredoxin